MVKRQTCMTRLLEEARVPLASGKGGSDHVRTSERPAQVDSVLSADGRCPKLPTEQAICQFGHIERAVYVDGDLFSKVPEQGMFLAEFPVGNLFSLADGSRIG